MTIWNNLTKKTGSAVAVGAVCALALSACGGGDAGGDEKTLKLGFPGGVGTTDVPAILALEALKEDGWDASYIEFDSPDVQTQALLRGDVNVASMGPATVMSANLAGSDIQIISNNNRNDLQIVVAPDIEECEDLDGKPVAYHSEGSTSTAHLKTWLSETCPEANPEFLVISGSANRATALLEGQIAGTIVRLEDWVPAIKGKESQGKILTSLSEDQADLLTQTITVTDKVLAENEDMPRAYLDALQAEFEQLQDDPKGYAEEAAKILEDDETQIAELYEQLVSDNVIPDAVGIDLNQVDATIKFYQENGAIPEGELTADEVADDRFNR